MYSAVWLDVNDTANDKITVKVLIFFIEDKYV
jgi:hypothetical protein